MSALVVDAVVRDGRIHITDYFYRTRSAKAAKSWGDGVELQIRIEPKDEAQTHAQRKFYFGMIVDPLAEYTGYRKDEWHVMLKAQFMPDGKDSITQLNHDEMRDYVQACEQWARETLPDAFALYERGAA